MNEKVLRAIAAIPGIPMLFIAIGLIVQPAETLPNLSMPLLEGAALSTQLGDMTSFFACTAGFIFMGAFLGTPRWLYAGAVLLIVTALARIWAWLVHGAEFSPQPITIEVVSAVWLVTCGLLLQRRAKTV